MYRKFLNPRRVRRRRHPADLEVGDPADLETWATWHAPRAASATFATTASVSCSFAARWSSTHHQPGGTKTSSLVKPARRAWQMKKMRSALGTLNLRLMTSRGRRRGRHRLPCRCPRVCRRRPGRCGCSRTVTVSPASAGIFQAFRERAADGHRFVHAYYLRGKRGIGLRNSDRAPAPRRQSAESWW